MTRYRDKKTGEEVEVGGVLWLYHDDGTCSPIEWEAFRARFEPVEDATVPPQAGE